MSSGQGCAAGPHGDVLESVAWEADARAGEWFPDLDGHRVLTHVIGRLDRPSCSLLRLELDGGGRQHGVIVKIRRTSRRHSTGQGRPTLMPEGSRPDDHITGARREYDGLRLVQQAVGPAVGDRFGVVRPLAWFAEHAAIVMDEVTDKTLRASLVARSRLRLGPFRGSENLRPWNNAGAWLRIFHGAPTDLPIAPRNADRAEILVLLRRYQQYLADRVSGAPLVAELAEAAAVNVEHTLADKLDLVTGHGDYVARNMFASGSGRITVFDPMPRWQVPHHEDLARFVVGMRLLGLQTVTEGLALSRAELDRYERSFLIGYFGEDPMPVGSFLGYEALILMDKWAAMVASSPSRPLQRTAHLARVRLSNRHFRREARVLLGRLADPAAWWEASPPVSGPAWVRPGRGV